MAREIKTSNPFLDDEDVDDDAFLNHPRQGSSGYILGTSEKNEWESKRIQILEEKRRIEERTLQSTNNAVGLIHESEQIGILTAEELMKQKEQLQNIDGNLDFINSTMRTSQKHINSIKSMFGGFKNIFSKGNASDTASKSSGLYNTTDTASRSSGLYNTVEDLKTDSKLSEARHPALRIKDISFDDIDSPGTGPARLTSPTASTGSNIEKKIDENIDDLSKSLGRLKMLATGLHDEIETQNEMLDNIHNKADKADETLEYQNRQINRILKK